MTLRNAPQVLAPSMVAASRTETGTDWIPAYRVIITNGNECHTTTAPTSAKATYRS